MKTIDVDSLEVKNNPEKGRFEIQLDDQVGVLQYEKEGDTYIYTHTGVPTEYGGQGIAQKLAKAALDTAQAEGAKIVPICPFVQSYVKKHPEYQPMVTELK